MNIILGIDPGSRYTGYGLIYQQGAQIGCIAHGHIHCTQNTMGERLHHIFIELQKVIEKHQPQEISIERIFTKINAQSALKLAQARGIALMVAAFYSVKTHEYTAKQVKKSVVGYGAADKNQVQQMVKTLLQLKQNPQEDAADALAIALCHCHNKRLANKLELL